MGLLVDLGANSVNKGGVESMTMVRLEVCVFQHTRVKICTGAQLDVQFIRLGSMPAFEGFGRVGAKCAVWRDGRGRCRSWGQRGLIEPGGRGFDSLCKGLLTGVLWQRSHDGRDRIHLDYT